MVEVVPFSGILYNKEKVKSYSLVTAPPYDVIKPPQQEELYAKNPHNVVRLILGKILDDDDQTNNRYTRSAKEFQNWLDEDVLLRDEKPGFYVYSQEYEFNGERIKRIGFFARVKLEDFSAGKICPHEFTLAKAKKDRTLLLKECRANFSPIFGLFSDPEESIDQRLLEISKQTPIDTVEENGVTHRLWRMQDTAAIEYISKQFADKKIYIADGHHRYETALGYHKENGEQVKDCAHVMMFLTNLDSKSLSIYPIHRQIKCPSPFDRDQFIPRMEEFFDIERLPEDVTADQIRTLLEEKGKEDMVFGVCLGKGDCRLLKIKDTKNILPHLGQDEPEALQVLGVSQLHTLVIKNILGIDTKNPDSQNYVSYTVNISEAIKSVEEGTFDLAFFLNATPMSQVRSLAEKGIRLPQKATYFYPKLLSGLVINQFEP